MNLKRLFIALLMCATFFSGSSIAFADTTDAPIGSAINSEIQQMQSDTARNPGFVHPNNPSGINLNKPVARHNITSGVKPTFPSETTHRSPSSVNPNSTSGTGAITGMGGSVGARPGK